MQHLLLSFFIISFLSACTDSNSVSTGLFRAKTIDWEATKDPDLSGVACHVQHVTDNLSFSDPSNMSIACRQVGEITPKELEKANIEKPKMIFKESKSIFFKTLKVRRTYDSKNQVLIYTIYSTKEVSGSIKHSISTVPLFNTQAYKS
jgi:CreA protein